jgi:hypothetical protein
MCYAFTEVYGNFTGVSDAEYSPGVPHPGGSSAALRTQIAYISDADKQWAVAFHHTTTSGGDWGGP